MAVAVSSISMKALAQPEVGVYDPWGPILAVSEEKKYYRRGWGPTVSSCPCICDLCDGFLSSAMLRGIQLHLMPTFIQCACVHECKERGSSSCTGKLISQDPFQKRKADEFSQKIKVREK